MKTFYGLPPADFYSETALALGFFDGVHLGHQELLKIVKDSPYPCGVLTFDTPPKKAGKQLQSNEEKLRLLADMGMDFVILLPFTEAFSKTPPADFVREVLVSACHARQVVVGENYRFGADASGTVETLKTLAEGFSVQVCSLLASPYGTVSSSLIRELLSQGRVDAVADLLGRPYTLSGEVIHGRKLGRTMGYPTANLQLPDLLLPKNGVYETRVTVDGDSLPAVTNIGTRPTVNGAATSIESHLLGFDRMIYGKTITLSFVRYLREERKFPTPEALFAQIRADGEAVLKDL